MLLREEWPRRWTSPNVTNTLWLVRDNHAPPLTPLRRPAPRYDQHRVSPQTAAPDENARKQGNDYNWNYQIHRQELVQAERRRSNRTRN